MKIVVTFAVFSEFKPWAGWRPFRRVSAGGFQFYETRIAGADVRVLLTGVGARNATEVIRHALEIVPGLFIVSGLAGGLRPEHRVGDVLAARGVCAAPGDSFVPCEERFLRLAVDCGARGVERFLSVKTIARTAAEKSCLGASADAVEMESFALMSEIARRGIPVLALRSIADPAGSGLPCDFERTLDSEGRVGISRIIFQVVRRPQTLPALVRFGLASHRAAASLARYLDRYVETVAATREGAGGVFAAGEN